MRIAYICTSFYNPSETFVRDLAAGLQADGHEVRLLANRVTPSGREVAGLDVVELPFLRKPWLVTKAASAVAERLRVEGRLSSQRLDREYATARLLPALRGTRPHVIYTDYGTNGVLALAAARTLGCPLVVHFHGFDASVALANKAYCDGVADVVRSRARLIVPSDHLRRRLAIEFGGGIPIAVIPCFPCRDRSILDDAVEKTAWPSVISLGRLTGKKCPLALVEAFRLVKDRVPRARFTMIGDGELSAVTRRRVMDLEFGDDLRLCGALGHSEALALLRSHWVFAQHSVTSSSGDQEGLPVAILEAMLLGIPVASTVHSGIPEIVRHDDTGFLCREHDFEAMADHLVRLLEDPGTRERLATNAAAEIGRLEQRTPRVQTITKVLEEACAESPRNR